MRKIRFIATGGTISCIQSENGLVPGLSANEILSYIDIDCSNIDCDDFMRIDSSNIQPEQWQSLAQELYSRSKEYDALIVTHGTDTMAYTASMMSYLLCGIDIPIIFTGSQHPINELDSDGRINLKNAIIAANNMESKGVFVCFYDRLIRGCRASKTHSRSLDAFESINAPLAGRFENDKFVPVDDTIYNKAVIDTRFNICSDVALLKLFPGMSEKLIDMLPSCGVKAVVVEGFGLGGVHNFKRNHAQSLISLINSGIPVVVTTQCFYESASLDVYEVSRSLKDAGAICAYDMSTEAIVTKLMWILGQTKDISSVKALMNTNICGDINI